MPRGDDTLRQVLVALEAQTTAVQKVGEQVERLDGRVDRLADEQAKLASTQAGLALTQAQHAADVRDIRQRLRMAEVRVNMVEGALEDSSDAPPKSIRSTGPVALVPAEEVAPVVAPASSSQVSPDPEEKVDRATLRKVIIGLILAATSALSALSGYLAARPSTTVAPVAVPTVPKVEVGK